MVQARGRLFYKNLETIEYPADWWEALKARWLPTWAKRRWPIRYRHFEINAYYPTVKVADHEGHVWIPRQEDHWRAE